MKQERSFEEDTKVSENANLDEEWRKNPERMMYWSRQHALAITRTNRAREKLRVIKGEVKRDTEKERANVDLDIRRYPGDYDLPKNPTETAITGAINRDRDFLKFCDEQEERIKQAVNELIEAEEEENIYEGAVKAMQYKKRSLENLQSLWEKNYYGDLQNRDTRSRDARLENARHNGEGIRDQFRRSLSHDRD